MKKYCQTLTLVDNEKMITKTMILETFGTSDQRSSAINSSQVNEKQ